MATIFPREEKAEMLFDKILANPEACRRLKRTFYDAIDSGDEFVTENLPAKQFTAALFDAYENKDLTAFLMAVCQNSMFDLLRNAFLIPFKFNADGHTNPIFLTDEEGKLLESKKREVTAREYEKFHETYRQHQCAPRSKLYLADGYDIVRSYTEGMQIQEKKENKKRGVMALYALPDTRKLDFSTALPGFLRKPAVFVMGRLLKSYPLLSKSKCVGCGKCAESCPAHIKNQNL